LLACRGDFASADEHIRKAQSLDPLSLIIRTNIGWLHYFQKNYANAEEAYQEVLKIDPGVLPARQKLWITYAVEEKTEQAAAELENLMRLFGHQNLLHKAESAKPANRYQVDVQTYVESGTLSRHEKARYLALLGRKPEAVHALGETAAQRSPWMVCLRIEPVFDQANLPELPKAVGESRGGIAAAAVG